MAAVLRRYSRVDSIQLEFAGSKAPMHVRTVWLVLSVHLVGYNALLICYTSQLVPLTPFSAPAPTTAHRQPTTQTQMLEFHANKCSSQQIELRFQRFHFNPIHSALVLVDFNQPCALNAMLVCLRANRPSLPRQLNHNSTI